MCPDYRFSKKITIRMKILLFLLFVIAFEHKNDCIRFGVKTTPLSHVGQFDPTSNFDGFQTRTAASTQSGSVSTCRGYMKILLHGASSIILNDASKIFDRKVEIWINLTQRDNRGLIN